MVRTLPCSSSLNFSARKNELMCCKAEGLARITTDSIASAMQVSETNLMVGLEGRASLLINLSKALKAKPEYFGLDGRPGHLIGTIFFLTLQRSS